MIDVGTDGLYKRLVDVSGIDPIDMNQRVRYCKAAGILPTKPRGPRSQGYDPQVESVHAVVMLLAATSGGPQTRSPEAVRTLWRLPYAETTGKSKSGRRGRPITFGRQLLMMMDNAATPALRAGFAESFKVINVAHGTPYASVMYWDGSAEQFSPTGAPPPSRGRAPISTLALAGPEVFLELGEIVMASRAEAKRLGVNIAISQLLSLLDGPQPKGGNRAVAA